MSEEMSEEIVVIRKGGFGSMVTGIILGSLIGGTVALLMAPQPGYQTRAMLAQKGGEARDKATAMVGDARDRITEAAGEARSRAEKAIAQVRGGTDGDKLEQDVNKVNRDVDIMESDIDKNYDM